MRAEFDPRLVLDVRRARRAAAREGELHGRLANVLRDEALARLLAAFARDDAEREQRITELLAALGDAPRGRSPSRSLRVAAAVLLARLGARRMVLRLLHESALSSAVRYGAWAEHLARTGCTAPARMSSDLSAAVTRQARALEAWLVR